jgi:hypothetical protein
MRDGFTLLVLNVWIHDWDVETKQGVGESNYRGYPSASEFQIQPSSGKNVETVQVTTASVV